MKQHATCSLSKSLRNKGFVNGSADAIRNSALHPVSPWNPWGARGRKFESCRPDQYLRDDDGTSVVPSVVPIPNDVFRGDTLGQDEQGFLGRDLECPDLDEPRADESVNGGGRCIADAQLDDFRRCAVHQRQSGYRNNGARRAIMHCKRCPSPSLDARAA